MHIDLDYYQAIKELLQQVGISSFEPCRELSTQYYFTHLLRFAVAQVPSMSFAIKHALCHLHSIMNIGTVEAISRNKNLMLLDHEISS